MYKKNIDFYELKTKLSEILKRIQRGKKFTITNRGKPVADLLPSRDAARQETTATIGTTLKISKTIAPVSDDVLEEYRKKGRR